MLAAPCPALESLRSPLRSGSSSWGYSSASGLRETLRQLRVKRASLGFCTLTLHPKGLSRSPGVNRGPRAACGPTLHWRHPELPAALGGRFAGV